MSNWVLYIPETHGDWDGMLVRLSGSSFFQTFGWGEVKRLTGWQVLRLLALDGSEPVAMAQVLVRRQPLSGAMVWVPGGVAGEICSWAASFKPALKRMLGVAWLYIRLNMLGHVDNVTLAAQLRAGGWRRPAVRMGSGLSLHYNPDRSEADRIAAASGNWRHNLKRSGKYGLAFSRWEQPDPERMIAIYRSMETYKGLGQQVSEADLAAMLANLGNTMALYKCEDANGEVIALRACGMWGDQAIDLLAAASPAARKQYASHGTIWMLMNDCAARHVRRYDMGGADPEGNKGVFDFKRGIGAELFSYLGEWESASPGIMRFAANAVLRLRRNSL